MNSEWSALEQYIMAGFLGAIGLVLAVCIIWNLWGFRDVVKSVPGEMLRRLNEWVERNGGVK